MNSRALGSLITGDHPSGNSEDEREVDRPSLTRPDLIATTSARSPSNSGSDGDSNSSSGSGGRSQCRVFMLATDFSTRGMNVAVCRRRRRGVTRYVCQSILCCPPRHYIFSQARFVRLYTEPEHRARRILSVAALLTGERNAT